MIKFFKSILNRDNIILVVIFLFIQIIINSLIFYLFYFFIINRGIHINNDLTLKEIFFILSILPYLFINNFIFAFLLKLFKNNKIFSENFIKKIKDFTYKDILKKTYLYSLIIPYILLLTIFWSISIISSITLLGIFITLVSIVILLILYLIGGKLLIYIEKNFDKITSFIGFIFRITIIIGTAYFLIQYINLRDIINIPISQITLKDIGKTFIIFVILYLFIYKWLLNQTELKEDINYKEWAEIGFGLTLFGGIIIYYLLNK